VTKREKRACKACEEQSAPLPIPIIALRRSSLWSKPAGVLKSPPQLSGLSPARVGRFSSRPNRRAHAHGMGEPKLNAKSSEAAAAYLLTTVLITTRSAVQEHHVLCDGLAANMQLIGREIRVSVTDRQTANYRKFCWDRQLRADDFGIPRY